MNVTYQPGRHQMSVALDHAECGPSTPELRRHVFAAYVQAMALYGSERAFEAAVWEALRRRPSWDLPTAVDHARKFIVPAYERAGLSVKGPVDPGDDDGSAPGAPAFRVA